MWIKLDSLPYAAADSTGRNAYLFAQLNSASVYTPHYAYISSADSKIDFYSYNNGTPQVSYHVRSSTAFTDLNWHNVVLQNQGDGDTLKIYLDGVDVSATAVVFAGTPKSCDSYTYFGVTGSTTSTAMPGIIDEIAIWRATAISKALINTNYSGGTPVQYPFVE
jgi:hypothetical protein